jgi:uncharacterized membrane protein required for colicin V production
VDLVGAIKSAPLVDLAFLFGLAIFLIIGVLQGAVRRLLDIGVLLLAFLFAANLRDTVGDFLSGNWRQFDLGYNRSLAFAILFIVLTLLGTAAVQAYYHRIELSPERPIVDDILGAIIGVVEGLFVLMIAVVILGSYMLPDPKPGDLDQYRAAQDLVINQSHIAHWLRDYAAPVFVHLTSPLLPSDVTTLFP